MPARSVMIVWTFFLFLEIDVESVSASSDAHLPRLHLRHSQTTETQLDQLMTYTCLKTARQQKEKNRQITISFQKIEKCRLKKKRNYSV